MSKTNQGGLTRKVAKPKYLEVVGCDDKERNVVQIFEKYVGLLPPDSKCSTLYRYAASSKVKSP